MDHHEFSVVVIDNDLDARNATARALGEIMGKLEEKQFSIAKAYTGPDGLAIFLSHTLCCAILIDWSFAESADTREAHPSSVIKGIRARNDKIPIFIITGRHMVQDIPPEVMDQVNGYLWVLEDTPHFIAGHIEEAARTYIDSLMPPFFKELVKYTEECKYAWHTPGHSGGLAFLKSPAGHIFFDFFGENMFRSDLSVSVPELGTLMEHAGVNGEAEREAAKTFGAEQTYFVTNGTSTANKMVMFGCATPGDTVLIDRNCHKSLQHAITMTGAVPIYLIPSRNAYGIIGGIHESEFDEETIRRKIEASPLIKDKSAPIKQVTVTNSTYDGLTYNVVTLKNKLRNMVENLHFDEAWYAYARFNPIYTGRYAMCDEHEPDHPAMFSTQSTHKLLAAFSQASMVHAKSGRRKIDPERFNEAFMMHTSTSPQYGIIASLDVAQKMMQGALGQALVRDSIEEAVTFRKKMIQIAKETAKHEKDEDKKWWFQAWQNNKAVTDMVEEKLETTQDPWILKPGDDWHGFAGMEPDYMMLDPIKVTLITPGMFVDGSMSDWGIPAPILTSYLMTKGVVVEKTGFYTTLLLFSIGVTKGKSGTMLAELFEFKHLFDRNAPLEEVFPELVAKHPGRYAGQRLKDLACEMHEHLKKEDIAKITSNVFSLLPDQEMTPAEAYAELVRDNVEEVPMRETMGRIPAVMLVPYPPGIPIIMPGEKITQRVQAIVDYMSVYEDFDNGFPGFETETHGIIIKELPNGRKSYYVNCIK